MSARLLSLGLLAALVGAGCSIHDCGSFGDVTTATVSRSLQAVPPASFVVAVEAWDARVDVYVPAAVVSVEAASGPAARLALEAEAGDVGRSLDLTVRLAARGDTLALVVERPQAEPHAQARRAAEGTAAIRPVCSPVGPYLQVQSLRVEVPAGVEFRGVVRPGEPPARVRA